MKRRVWLIAGVVAVLVSFLLIKKQREAHKQQGTEENASLSDSGTSKKDQKTTSGQPQISNGIDTSGSTAPQQNGSVNSDGTSPQAPSVTAVTPGVGHEAPTVNSATPPKSGEEAPATGSPHKLDTAKQEPVSIGAPPTSGKAGNTNVAGKDSHSSGTTTNATGSAQQQQGSAATSKPVPVATPQPIDIKSKASFPTASCDAQWQQHVALFKSGADMVYMTSIAVQRPLASDISTSHIETITQSSPAHVVRDISFSSDHPSGILVLSSLNAAPSISTSKENFLALCQATGGRAVGSALFKLSHAKLLDIADDNVKVGFGTFPVYRMKLEAALLINAKVTTAIAEIWVAKNKSGLVVKETIRIPPKVFADHGSITISSQLAGGRKI